MFGILTLLSIHDFFWVALENDARIAVSRLAFPFLNRVQVSIC